MPLGHISFSVIHSHWIYIQRPACTFNLLSSSSSVTGTAWFDDIELTPAAGSEISGEIGRVVRLVTTHYAQRGPVDSIVPTLAALKGAAEGISLAVLDGLSASVTEELASTGRRRQASIR